MKAERFAAVYEPNLPRPRGCGVAILTPARTPGSSRWKYVSSRTDHGGHDLCPHLHRSFEAAERCGRTI